MASYKDLELDWSGLEQNSPAEWTDRDLQLAAELGKTLLERNKELENSLKHHQNVIEDQTQEIEYLTKQTAALREVNDSRLRIYEQLEVSIQELERTNQRLVLDSNADKKHIKSLCASIDSLESRCEELQKSLDELTVQQEAQRRRQQKTLSVSSAVNISMSGDPDSPGNGPANILNGIDNLSLLPGIETDDEQIFHLLGQLQEMKSLRTKDQRKVSELEEQIASLLKENINFEEQVTLLQQKEEDMKFLQEEISTLEEVRQGQLCRRCLRPMEANDELSMVLTCEDDDVSVPTYHRSTALLYIEDFSTPVRTTPKNNDHSCPIPFQGNPYRDLVEKYEALIEVQRQTHASRHMSISNNCLSLDEELRMSGDFNVFNRKEIESDPEETDTDKKNSPNMQCNKETNKGHNKKVFSTTPTDFSEAETSSSGFSDETSNKATQTDTIDPKGAYLCSIKDGDDCRFSIYDDINTLESRFRKTPEYKQLFKEIFAVLKRAAENKDDGEPLPLLDDLTPVSEVPPRVPPVTPAREEAPSEFPSEDSLSVQSEEPSMLIAKNREHEKIKIAPSTISLPDTSDTRPVEIKIAEIEPKPVVSSTTSETATPAPKSPPKVDRLEYLQVGVGVKKKHRKHSPIKVVRTSLANIQDVLETMSQSPPQQNHRGNKKRNFFRHGSMKSPKNFGPWGQNEQQQQTPSPPQQRYSFPNTTYNSPPPPGKFASTASQEVAKLKHLELSYAEVLRKGPPKRSNTSNGSYNRGHQI